MAFVELNGHAPILARVEPGPKLARAEFENAEGRTSEKPRVAPAVISEAMAVLDAGLVFLSGALTKVLYLDLGLHSGQPSLPFVGAAAVASALTYLVSRETGNDEPVVHMRRVLDARRVGLKLALVFLSLATLLFALDAPEAYSPGWIGLWFTASYGLLLAARTTLGFYSRVLGAEGRLAQRVAIYGSGDFGVQVASALIEHDHNVALAGIYDDLESGQETMTLVRGGISDLIAYAQAGHCDRILVALPITAKDRIATVTAKLAILPIDVQLCPDGLLLPGRVYESSTLGPLLLLAVQQSPLNAREVVVKTIMDYTLAAIALAAVAPLMLLIALAIKLDTRGPIFFIQSRHGYNSRVIRIIKFRSMTVLENGAVVVQAQRHDARVTRIGRFLRRTSLDELPQLINVLRGELSLVGPRPHAVIHNETYAKLIENYANRHKIKPGITGWAQVNGCRGETRDPDLMRRRIKLDLWYIDNWSSWLDVRILMKTMRVPFDPHVY